MKHLLKAAVACGLVAGLQQAAQAQISFSSSSSLTAWAGSPIYTSLANSALSGATTGQGDPTITGNSGVMAESFTTGSSGFTLSGFNILTTINTAGTYTIDLINLGAAGTVSDSASSASYLPSTVVFTDTIALSPSGSEVQGMFGLAGSDQVTLAANEQYALEILTPSSVGQNGLLWFRASTADPLGQMFSGVDGGPTGTRNTLAGSGQAGGAPRTGAIALYTVPEPSFMALFGLGAGALALRRRKN